MHNANGQSSDSSRTERAANDTLQDSKALALYRALAANLPGGAAFVVDHDLRYLLAEGEALAAAGMTSADFEGKTIYEALDPTRLHGKEVNFRRALAGESFEVEHSEDGRHYVTRGTPLRDAQGHVYAALAVSYDITERKQAEGALRESEQRLQRMMNAPRVGVLTFDFSGTLLDANDAFLDMVGYSRDEFEARTFTWQDFTPQEYVEASERIMESLHQTGRGGPYEKEYFRKDGTRVWMMFVAADLGDGTIVEYAVDISDHKRAEAALRQSEQKYRAMFEAIGEGISILEVLFDEDERAVDYRFVENNPAVVQMTEIGNSVGKTVLELFPNFDKSFIEIAGEVARSGRPIRFQHFVPEIDRWFDVHETRVGGESSRIVIAAFADITERKRHERRQEFLLKLSDRLRPLSDATDILRTAARVVGEELEIDRVLYAEIGDDGDTITIADNYVRGDFPQLVGRFTASDFGKIAETLRAKQTFVTADSQRDEGLPAAEREALRRIKHIAILAVPLVKAGHWVSNLGAFQGEPREWTADEIALVEEAAERTWAAVERARAEEALRQSEQAMKRMRDYAEATLRTSPLPLLVLEHDLRVITANEAFYRNFKTTPAEIEGRFVYDLGNGQWNMPALRELLEDILPHHTWFEHFEITHDFEYIGRRTMLLNARRMENEAGMPARIVLVIDDITERKLAEERVKALTEITSNLIATQTLSDVRRIILGRVIKALGANGGVVFLVTPKGLAQEAHELNSRADAWPLDASHPACEAARAGKPIFIENAEVVMQRYPNLAGDIAQVNTQGVALLPLKRGDEVFGVLALSFAEPRRWSEGECAFASALGDRVAVAYERARLFEGERDARARAEATTRRVESLQAMTANLSKARTPAEIIQVVFTDGLSALGAAGSVFALLTDDGGAFMIVSTHGYKAGVTDMWRRFPAQAKLPMSDVVRSGEPLFLASPEEAAMLYPDMMASAKSGHKAWAVAPLATDGRALGAVSVSFAEPRTFDADERDLFIALTRQCALALDRARLFEATQQWAATLEARVAERTAELRASEEQLRTLSLRSERAREKDRVSIAREVHDELGGSLTGLKFTLAQVRSGRQADAALMDVVHDMASQIDELVSAVRRIASDLRPPMLDDLGLLPALEWQAQEFEKRTDIPCNFNLPQREPHLNQEQRTAIFRAFQEALTNVARHADAKRVVVAVTLKGREFVLSVTDDGVGIRPDALRTGKSLGLAGMRERMREVSGDAEVLSTPGRGTTVIIRAPVADADMDEEEDMDDAQE